MRLIQLLEQKNHYLEKYLTLNETQLSLLKQGEIDSLDEFYTQRDEMLNVISYIDTQVSECTKQNFDYQTNDRDNVKNLLHIKNQYIYQILDQDVQILSLIDQAKSLIIKELQDIKKGKIAIKGYHSKDNTVRLSEKV